MIEIALGLVLGGSCILVYSCVGHALPQYLEDRRARKAEKVALRLDLHERERAFVYHILQAAENADKGDLAKFPTDYVAHFSQMQKLLKIEFPYLIAKVRDSLI